MTREELREIAIFVTHYVGFPLGSKLDGAFKRVVAKRKKAEEKGAARDRRTTSTTPSRCTSAGTSMTSRYAALSREQLAILVPELLLIGQLIDRSGMAWCISAFRPRGDAADRDRGVDGAPARIYTRRMQKALKYEGVDVVTIFKGLQLDIGAPPQFMDFRYAVHDRWHGEFHLDHCGALMDVEPMGEDYVRGMCHDIEDPTFDATARRHQPQGPDPADPPAAARSGRPAPALRVDGDHRRVLPRGRRPSRRWTSCAEPARATTELDPIDPDDEGTADYSGALLSDLDFGAFSHSALVRIADEVCLQMHLLNLSFVARGGQARGHDAALARTICTKQLIGIAGLAAERIHRRWSCPAAIEGALRMLELHPLFNPAAYVSADVRTGHRACAPLAGPRGRGLDLAGRRPSRTARCRRSSPPSTRTCDVEVTGTDTDWTAQVIETDTAAKELPEVSVVQVQRRRDVVFEPRKSLPLTVV